MNGLLTALLGGAAGAGQGLQYQDEKARALAQLKLAQDAQQLEKSKIRADLFMRGLVPSDDAAPPTVAPQGIPAPPPPSDTSNAVPLSGVSAPAAPRIRSRDGFVSAPAPAPAPAPPQSGETLAGLGGLSALMANSGQTVNLPGVGNFRYDFNRSPLGIQAVMDAYKKRIETDEKIREANATGVTAKNFAEFDPEAQGKVAAAKAAATLPVETQKMLYQANLGLRNETNLEGIRAQVQAMLQKNQQDFDLKKLTAEQKFTADQTAYRMAGEFANQLGMKQWEEGGAPVARLTRGMFGSNAPANPPSLPPLTAEQSARAQANPSYKAFLEAQGYRSF